MAFISGDPNLNGPGNPVSATGGFVTGDPNLGGVGSPAQQTVSDSAASGPSPQITQTPVAGGSTVAGAATPVGAAPSSSPSTSSGTSASSVITTVPGDMRIRLAALNPSAVYQNSPIMAILNETSGMLFPYTPSITVTQAVDYMTIQLVHSNTDYQAYTRTPSVKITVNGKFTVQNQREGRYALAAIHFLRTVSKSYFGEKDAMATGGTTAPSPTNLLGALNGTQTASSGAGSGKAGLPPPVLLFSGYGNLMFNRLRVILTNHSYTFDDSMDTVPIVIGSSFGSMPLGILQGGGISGGVVRLPAMFTISCDLTVIQTPKRMRQVFSFEDFASGALLNSSDGGWI